MTTTGTAAPPPTAKPPESAKAPATPIADVPEIAWRDGRLHVEGHALDELADRHGTPLYVYSAAAMRRAAARWQSALAGRDHLVCYAVKANASLAVLQLFASLGCGFDIVSRGELERVLAAGADPSTVVFSGVGKTRGEMRRALAAGVACFNVESTGELDVLSAIAAEAGARARVSLRVNPDVDARTHPYISTGLASNKFGIAHAEARAAFAHAGRLEGLEVVGIDCHIGSQIVEIAPYVEALDRLLDLVEQVERDGLRLAHLDLGGGLGIAYAGERPPAVGELVAALLARIDARGHAHRRIVVEPGRSLVGNAGVLVAEALYEKRGETKRFLVVDAAMNDLLRPTLYDAWMGIVECDRRRARETRVVDVVGPVCESGDWLGRDRALAVAPGDRVAVLSAGAYAMSMASNYNARGRAAEVLVDGDAAHLVRARETIADQMRGESLVPPRPAC